MKIYTYSSFFPFIFSWSVTTRTSFWVLWWITSWRLTYISISNYFTIKPWTSSFMSTFLWWIGSRSRARSWKRIITAFFSKIWAFAGNMSPFTTFKAFTTTHTTSITLINYILTSLIITLLCILRPNVHIFRTHSIYLWRLAIFLVLTNYY